MGGGAVNTAVIDAEIEVEEQDDTEDSVEIVSVDLGVGGQLSVDAVACYVNEIKNIDDDNLAVDGDHQKEDNVYSISMAAGVGVSDKDGSIFTAFKTLLSCGGIEDVTQCASDLVKQLQLGKLEKGAATTASKFKSLKGRWFSQKGDHEVVDGGKDGERYIQRDSLINSLPAMVLCEGPLLN